MPFKSDNHVSQEKQFVYPAKRTVGKSKFANKIGEEISEEYSMERERGGSHIFQHPSTRENAVEVPE